MSRQLSPRDFVIVMIERILDLSPGEAVEASFRIPGDFKKNRLEKLVFFLLGDLFWDRARGGVLPFKKEDKIGALRRAIDTVKREVSP